MRPVVLNDPSISSTLYAGPSLHPSQWAEQKLQVNKIRTIFCLLEKEAVERENIHEFYFNCGVQVYYYSIPDFGVPISIESVKALVERVQELLLKPDNNVFIHCRGGIGRTGTILGCIVAQHLNLSGQEAISYVRRYIPGAVETSAQAGFVKRFASLPSASDPQPFLFDTSSWSE